MASGRRKRGRRWKGRGISFPFHLPLWLFMEAIELRASYYPSPLLFFLKHSLTIVLRVQKLVNMTASRSSILFPAMVLILSASISPAKSFGSSNHLLTRNVLENGLPATPPMGWSSRSRIGCEISEKIIRETADALISTGLAGLGYEYVNIDDCWAEYNRNTQGNLLPNISAFPSGFESLATYVHGKGLKLGIFSDAGYRTCKGQPGSLGFENQDAFLFASWGADYLRYGNCYSYDGSKPEMRYGVMHDALLNTNRPIFYSLCGRGEDHPATWGPKIANSWCTTEDTIDSWSSVTLNADQNDAWAVYAGPGGWNDPGMLQVGNGGMTKEEYRSHFSIWSIIKAPLIFGCDVRSLNNDTIEILSNKEVIAVNQDVLGVQGDKVSIQGDWEVWAGPLSNNNTVVLLLNKGESQANIRADWSDMGLKSYTSVRVRDLWQHQDWAGTYQGNLTASVCSHCVVMLLLQPV